MGNSIEYIKGRIKMGDTKLSTRKFGSMYEKNIYDIIEENDTNKLYELETSDGMLVSEVYYDENAEFDCYVESSSRNDGTFVHMYRVAERVLKIFFEYITHNSEVWKEDPDVEGNVKTYHFKYTIGNIVCCSEHGDEFSTKEKPWMKSKFTALLPIKIEIVE